MSWSAGFNRMDAARLTKLAATVHFGLAAAAIYYTVRVNNHADLSAISAKEFLAICGVALLPALSAWVGLALARTSASRLLVAVGQTVALGLFAATFVMVLHSVEPMAPLLFLLVSIWLAGGLAVWLAVVWLVGRRKDR